MLPLLALRTDPDRVYDGALQSFTPEEIGEAFAAAQGLAIPTELQRYLKEDPRDLVGRFRELAPPYPPISIQRWSVRRVALAARRDRGCGDRFRLAFTEPSSASASTAPALECGDGGQLLVRQARTSSAATFPSISSVSSRR